MKQLLFFGLVFFLSFDIVAQDEHRKPSWSPPLPEKRKMPKSSMSLNNKLLQKEDIQVESISFDPTPVTGTIPGLNDNTIKPLDIESVEIEPVEVKAPPIDRTEVSEEPINRPITEEAEKAIASTQSEIVGAQAPSQNILLREDKPGEKTVIKSATGTHDSGYSWTVVKSLPLTTPKAFQSSKTTVHLHVTINPAGPVVAVSTASANQNILLSIHASRSLHNWRLQAPQ